MDGVEDKKNNTKNNAKTIPPTTNFISRYFRSKRFTVTLIFVYADKNAVKVVWIHASRLIIH